MNDPDINSRLSLTRGKLFPYTRIVIRQSKPRPLPGPQSHSRPDLNITATAARVGITKGYLSKILSGRSTPSLRVAVKLAKVLGMPMEKLASDLAGYKRKHNKKQEVS